MPPNLKCRLGWPSKRGAFDKQYLIRLQLNFKLKIKHYSISTKKRSDNLKEELSSRFSVPATLGTMFNVDLTAIKKINVTSVINTIRGKIQEIRYTKLSPQCQ